MKQGSPKKAPKVAPPKPANGNYMKESDQIKGRTSPQQPMRKKNLSK
jgi:hypothetical protein